MISDTGHWILDTGWTLDAGLNVAGETMSGMCSVQYVQYGCARLVAVAAALGNSLSCLVLACMLYTGQEVDSPCGMMTLSLGLGS